MLTADQERERSYQPILEPQKIDTVEDYENGYGINYGYSGFILSKEYLGNELPPAVGDDIVVYIVQGSLIRGVDLRGEPLYFKTNAELELDREKALRDSTERKRLQWAEDREDLLARVAALPPEYQRRIEWFRVHLEGWDIEFLAYELFACEQAIVLAGAAKASGDDPREWLEALRDMKYSKQIELVPEISDQHSGNTFGVSLTLALLSVQEPLLVVAMHGAMVGLTGCEEYGCAHPREDDVMEAIAAQTKEN